jgi:hypothetical protein
VTHYVEWFTRGRWWHQHVTCLHTFVEALRLDGITRYRVNGAA